VAFAWLSPFEWILIELIVLGILVWQLISVRRAIRADRQAAKTSASDAPGRPAGENSSTSEL